MKRIPKKEEHWNEPYGWDDYRHDGRYFNRDFEQQYKRKEEKEVNK